MTYASPALLSAVGQPREQVAGRIDAEWASDSAEAVAILTADRRMVDGGCTDAVEEVFTGSNRARVLLSRQAPRRDADGTVWGLVGISTDFTERNHAGEQRALLIHELNRRVKNTLATVQSIAQQGSPDWVVTGRDGVVCTIDAPLPPEQAELREIAT